MPFERITVLGLDFDQVSCKDILDWIDGRKGCGFRYVVTPNVDHLVRLDRRPDLLGLYRQADICVCDSRVLAGLCTVFGLPVPVVSAGSDLIELAAKSGYFLSRSVTVVGGSIDVVDELIRRRLLRSVAHYNPPMGFLSDAPEFAKCVEFVESNDSDVVIFAVGSPQQEALAHAVKVRGRARGVGLCVGASLLFITGDEFRAPRFVRRLRLEWLFRLVMNPRRLARRYLVDGPQVLSLLWKHRMRLS